MNKIMNKEYDQMKILIIILFVLNILLGFYIAFIKPSAYSLERLKAGGIENMRMAKQLYKSDMYIQQQKATLEQILGSMNQADTMTPVVDTSTEIPVVTQ